MAEIDQEEGISAEQIVVNITEDGYVTSHGDHYHFYNGKVPFDALISQELIWTDATYQLDKADIVNEVEDGYIIKRQDAYYLYLREGSQKVRIRQ
ncbi:pneumococcal-type histidine triad protein [Streptococcus ovuberis]|uniref:Pneumococcal-type histidine triad protein n=2 Tax=Streptococcus ovuberis TaxID=1936207 RepID=A0A7X6MZ82_9STRE|nr:pneumococcal-type histidine triad protein [Streptococcus ovuberis]